MRRPLRTNRSLRLRGNRTTKAMCDDNKNLVLRHFFELWALGDLLVADEIYDASYVNHSLPLLGARGDAESEKRLVVLVRTAFSGLEVHIEDAIAAGDRVVVRWSMVGSDTGGFMGRPPTARAIRLQGVKVARVGGGKIREAWDVVDTLELQRQLGLVVQTGAQKGSNDDHRGES